MKNKISKYFIIIGIIIFVLGTYAFLIKAGLPYPDPTPELARKWLFYYNFGKISMLSGVILLLTGIVFKIVLKLKKK